MSRGGFSIRQLLIDQVSGGVKVFSRENIPTLTDPVSTFTAEKAGTETACGQLLCVGSKRRALEMKTTHGVHKMMSCGGAAKQGCS